MSRDCGDGCDQSRAGDFADFLIARVSHKNIAGAINGYRARGTKLRLLFGAVLIVVVVASVVGRFLSSAAFGDATIADHLLQGASYVGSWIVVTVVFVLVMKYLPRRTPPARSVLLGACTAAALFELGKYFIAYYLSRSLFAAAYGPSSAMVVVLLWTYYSVQIFLLGAEIAAMTPHDRQPGDRAAA